MNASSITIASTCILLGFVACSAPQGKKLASADGTLAPIATGPIGPATKSAVLTGARSGQVVNLIPGGTVKLTLDSDDKDGYAWRLSQIPDPTVLKVVSQQYIPPATPEGRGHEEWVFQSTGSGDVEVRMWYRDFRTSPMSGNPRYNFITVVSNETKANHPGKSKTKAPKQGA